MSEQSRLDPSVVSGLIEERCAAARSGTFEGRWERDDVMWQGVLSALKEAEEGRTPRSPRTEPPSWLAPLVRSRLKTLATYRPYDSTFAVVRSLERLGLVVLEADETYVLAAVGGVGERWGEGRTAVLRGDRDLLDKVIWRMFEVEGAGEVSLANVDKFSADGAGWQATFIELIADGTLPRERVLTSSLAALNRDFSAYRAGWYSRLYEALAPTGDELSRHQSQLRTLLRSTIPATVRFSLGKLWLLSKQDLLDGPATLPALRPAVLVGPKTTAAEAVRLVDAIVARRPELIQAGSEVAGAALEHPHADVQVAAGRLLRKLGAVERLEGAAEFLEPSVRADLLGERTTPDDPQGRRVSVERRTPIGTVLTPVGDDDLLDRLAALLEDASDPLEVELVLAGLAALYKPQRLRPLTKRATAILQRGPPERVTRLWLRGQLARLVLAASGTALAPSPTPSDPALGFLLHRLTDVEAILRQQRPTRVLIATPDDPSGWLSARAFVERLRGRTHPPDQHDQYDLIAGMLRIHPDDREDGLRQAEHDVGGLTGNVADCVRYALGSPPPAARRTGDFGSANLENVGAWIAASRSRLPTSSDAWLAAQGVAGAGRSDPIEASAVFESRPYTWIERGRVHESLAWDWEVEIRNQAVNTDAAEPTAVAGGGYDRFTAHDYQDFVGWLASIWPHECEHFLVTGIHSVLRAAESTEVSHDAVRVLNSVASHPGHIGMLAETCLAAGLSASKADQRAASVDAVLQQSRAGRLSAAQLAAGLVAFRGPVTLTRLAASLRDVAATDRGSRNLVIDALAICLREFDATAHGVHAALELLREETLREGRPVPGELRSWLLQFQGGSRAAKAAKALLHAT